jgi:hypothetical protein
VQDAKINFVKDKDEWNGTDIVFDIAKKGSKTELRFTDIGLVPAIECYGKCAGAWGFYTNQEQQERDMVTNTATDLQHERGPLGMNSPPIVSREEWEAARKRMLLK